MAAYASLVSLINVIEQIQRHTRFPIRLDDNQMRFLHDKACFLIKLLESDSHGNGDEAKDLESRIADAAYEAEDIIESYVVDTITATSTTGQLNKKNTTVLSCLAVIAGLEIIIEKMEFIREEFVKLNCIRIQPTSHEHHTHESSSYIPFGKSSMVGFDVELIRMKELLTGYQSGRQIIPIVGMGGIGKTTLAKNVYEIPVLARHFDTRAWVTISQEYICRNILLGLLSHVKDGYTDQMEQMSEEKLGDRLYKRLFGMRYLVVLDDMWSIQAWQLVRMYFPENNNGSRIVVTTRLTSVASYLSTDSLVMNLLDENKSWNLLCHMVFCEDRCPVELEDAGRKIASNCKGLPLSIVVIGGLLAKSERAEEYWEYVARDTSSILGSEGDEHCMKILSLSYHSLPVHLKPCFLYMGIFSEDKEIRVSWLINLWIAEGLLKPDRSKDFEVTGKEYLNDLISRNLIFVHKRGSDGNIRLCNIHDLVRDLSLREAHKEKFLYVSSSTNNKDGGHVISRQRRICIPWSSSEEETLSQILNTVKLESLARSFISDMDGLLPLHKFRLLRVLKTADKDIKTVHVERQNKYLLDDTCHLMNSRYIAINVLQNSSFPSSVCLKWNLQILQIHGIDSLIVAPLEIWEMTELRQIEFWMSLTLPDPPSQDIGRHDDLALVNLQRAMGVRNLRFSDELAKKIPSIKKLRIIYHSKSGYDHYSLQDLVLLKKLQTLDCDFYGRPTDVPSNLAYPSSLRKLTLLGCKFDGDDMKKIGLLPQLEVLKLLGSSFAGTEWRPVEGQFQRLKFLQLSSLLNLKYWMVDSTHFPYLEYLVLRSLRKLVEIPSDVGEIPALQLIRIDLCTDSVVISAKELLKEQEQLGNVDLQVQVFCQKKAKLEILASDNFQVRTFMSGNAFSSPFLPFL